jgi:hypothetical protein
MSISQIIRAFEAEDFSQDRDYNGPAKGQRRWVVHSYHASVDPRSVTQERRLLAVYLDMVQEFGREDDGTFVGVARDLIRSLQRDGLPVSDDGHLSAPVDGGVALQLEDFHLLSDPQVVDQHLERMRLNIDRDTPAVIGAAKELLESVCKLVLEDAGVAYEASAGLQDLYRAAAKELRLSRDSVPGSAKGSEAAQRTLQGLVTAVQNLAELRNALGLGHGRVQHVPVLERHARLAMNASRSVADFLLATWHERKASSSDA